VFSEIHFECIIVDDFQEGDFSVHISCHRHEIGLLQQKLNLILDLGGDVVASSYRDPDDIFMHGM
jgi:hypothetical protein